MPLSDFSHQTQTLIRHFAREIPKGEAALVAGAGFSLNAEYIDPERGGKFELWTSLIHRACLGLGENASEFTRWYSYPEILEFYRQEFRDNALVDLIHGGIPDRNALPGDLHFKLLDPRRFLWSSIITTNIDTLVEKTLEALRIPYRRLAKRQDFGGGDGVPVIKLHGTYDDPETYIFTENEYNGIEVSKPLLTAKVRQVYAECSCFFIGYSLRDPDFRRVVQTVRDLAGVDLRLSLASIPSADDHEKTFWRSHGIRIISKSDLKLDSADIGPAEFSDLVIGAIEDAIDTEDPVSLSRLSRLTRIFRLREVKSFDNCLSDNINTNTNHFLQYYLSRRSSAKSDLFMDRFPREALRVLVEADGGEWARVLRSIFRDMEVRDLAEEPGGRLKALGALCQDIAEMVVFDLRNYGLMPSLSHDIVRMVMSCAEKLGHDATVLALKLGMDVAMVDASNDKAIDEGRYANSADAYIRTLPKYLNTLRLAEIGLRAKAKQKLLALREEFDRLNPLWACLILEISGDSDLAKKGAMTALSSRLSDVRVRLLAAQFLRDTEMLPAIVPQMHYEVSYFSSLAHRYGISTEDLDFSHIREQAIAVMLEVATRTTALKSSESSVEAFRKLLMRHRILGMPYQFYSRGVLAHWLQIELHGPKAREALIEYGGGTPRDCLMKTELRSLYCKVEHFSPEDWTALQTYAIHRLIQSMHHGDLGAAKGFFGKFSAIVMPYLTKSNFNYLFTEVNAGLLGMLFVDWKVPDVGRRLLDHDKELAVRYLETRRSDSVNVREVSGIIQFLNYADIGQHARQVVHGVVDQSRTWTDVIRFACFFSGHPESQTVLDCAKEARFMERSFSQDDGEEDKYRNLDMAHVNYVRAIVGNDVSVAREWSRDFVASLLAEDDARGVLSSASTRSMMTLLHLGAADEDSAIFDKVVELWKKEVEQGSMLTEEASWVVFRYVVQAKNVLLWKSLVAREGFRRPWGADKGMLEACIDEDGVDALYVVLESGLKFVGSHISAIRWLREMIDLGLARPEVLNDRFWEALWDQLGVLIKGGESHWLYLIPGLVRLEQKGSLLSQSNARFGAMLVSTNASVWIPERRLTLELKESVEDKGTDGVFSEIARNLLSIAEERGIL